MSTNLLFSRDLSGLNTYSPQFSTNKYSATLATGTHSTITVPSTHAVWIMYVRLQPSGWVWCARNATAAIPAGGTFAASNSDLISGAVEYKRTVYAGDVIDFITNNATCVIGVSFYQVSYP